MMKNQQAKRGKSKLCPNGCGTMIFFESRFGDDGTLVTKPDSTDSKWWMMEDASKELHSCPNKGKFQPKATGFAETRTEPQIDLTNFKPEYVSEAEIQVWTDIVGKKAELAILGQKKLGEYPELQNGQAKGLVIKSSFATWDQINKRIAKNG